MRPMTPEEWSAFKEYAKVLESYLDKAEAKRAYREACGGSPEYRWEDYLSDWEVTHIRNWQREAER